MKNLELKENSFIRITERKCSVKIQPSIKEGMLLTVKNIYVRNNIIYLTCLTTEHNKKVRCNSSRFSWVVTAIPEQISERDDERTKTEALKETSSLREQFPFLYNMRAMLYSRILDLTALKYADKVISYCVQNRVEVFKTLTHIAIEFRKEYNAQVAKDLKSEYINKIQQKADLWQKACEVNFIQIQYTVSNVLLHVYENVPEFIVNAYLARKLIELRRLHDSEMSSFLENKLGHPSTISEMKPITKLYNLLEGWFPEMDEINKVDNDLNIMTDLKVLKNKLSIIECGD